MKIEVLSVNISTEKGTIKKPIEKAELCDVGIREDAHSGSWHRQISLLAEESIAKFEKKAGRKINFGEFAENITTRGLELFKTAPMDRFVSEQIELMVTQIGKKCHGDNCAIFREVGNCVMPKEGIFAQVLRGGELKAGTEFTFIPRKLKIGIITLSDRAEKGIYEDKSGPAIREASEKFFAKKYRQTDFDYKLIADNAEILERHLEELVKNSYDVIFTTGGTGIGPRDITPDVVKPMLDKEIPGIMEMIRVKYGQMKANTLISRSVAGVMGQTLIYTLPGSQRAVHEYLAEILPTIEHSVYMIHGLDLH